MKKLDFSELVQEMEVLSQEETRKIKGGYDVAFSVMGEYYEICGCAPVNFNNSDLFNVYGSGNWYPAWETGGSSAGGGGGGFSELYSLEAAQSAISMGLSWNNFYGTLDAARLGRLDYSASAILREVVDTNVVQSLITDLKAASEFKGIAVLSSVGKLLGIASAYNSVAILGRDLTDGGGVNPMNIVDAGISVGSLFIKSNAVGFAVSAGWLLMKGEFE